MRVPFTPITTPRSGLQAASAPFPTVANADGSVTSWETEGSISLPRHPCAHTDLINCCVAPATVPGRHPFPKGVVATSWVGSYRADCEAIDSLSPGNDDVVVQAVAEADADAPAALARAFQFGMTTPYGAQPGLSTLPVISGVTDACGVRVYTCNGEDPTGAGDGLPIAQAWLTASEFWRVHGHPGVPTLLAADGLAGVFAAAGLTAPGQFGAVVQAGGNMNIVYAPGLAPAVGPSSIPAGSGFVWVWVLGGFYAAIQTAGTVRDIKRTSANTRTVIVDRKGIHSFGSCCVAAVKVAVCS